VFKSELKISPMHSLWDFQIGWNIALNLARVCDVSTNAVYTLRELKYHHRVGEYFIYLLVKGC